MSKPTPRRNSLTAVLCSVLGALIAGVVQSAEPVLAWVERLDPRFDALIAPDVQIELAVDGIEWAEGPVWDAVHGQLLYSDVPRNAIYRWRAGEPASVHLAPSGYTGSSPFAGRGPGSNGLVFDRNGRLTYCRHGDRDIARREADGTVTVLADRYQGRRLNSPNDLVYAANGDLYFTDPPFGLPASFDDPGKELPFQSVFRLTTRGELSAVVTDLEAPNGIGIAPDGRTLYVANAIGARPIWMAYPIRADGSLGPGGEFAHAREYVAPGAGVPDGLKLDVRGHVFAAGPGGIHVFAPDGTRLGRIVTGVPTGNLNWGEDGTVLYIAANHRILRLPTRTRGPVHPAGDR